MDWELVDLSVFFMMELSEVFLLSCSCSLLPGPEVAVEADLDLAAMASLCFALLAAVLPNSPGEGERLLLLEKNGRTKDGRGMAGPRLIYYVIFIGRR